LRIAVTGHSQQILSRFDRPARMFGTCKTREEKADRFIAHQAVHHGVRLDQYMTRDRVKAVDQLAELSRAHLLGQRRRTTDICKEHGQRDFRTSRMLKHFAFLAEARVVS
jgi:hypothetical protein